MPNKALHWITELLETRGIPYAVCGGLAAIGYGAERPLHDIDLFVPHDRFAETVAAGAAFISKPARRYKEYGWNVEYVQFFYDETKIEVGDAKNVQVQDHASGEWIDLPINFERCVSANVFGVDIPLMARTELIAYKRRLGRKVDLDDVRVIVEKPSSDSRKSS